MTHLPKYGTLVVNVRKEYVGDQQQKQHLGSAQKQSRSAFGSNMFSGRIGRLGLLLGVAYLAGSLIISALLAGSIVALSRYFPSAGVAAAILGMVLFLVRGTWAVITLLSIFSLGIRRLHDVNKPGILFLLTLLPLVGVVFLLYLFLAPGTKGPNAYGNPGANTWKPLEILGLREPK